MTITQEDAERIADAINDVSAGKVSKIEMTLKSGAPCKVYAVGNNVVRTDIKK